MLFGKKIKELREEHGMVQRKLAAALDIDTPMYSVEKERPNGVIYLLWPNYWKSTRKNY